MPVTTQIIAGVNKQWILKDPMDRATETKASEVWTAYDFSLYLERSGLKADTITINAMTRMRFLQECVIIFREPKHTVRFLTNPDPAALNKFSQDIGAIMSLDDPRIVKIHDYKLSVTKPPPHLEGMIETEAEKKAREENTYPPFYVMDRIDGDRLDKLAAEEKAYKGKIHESLNLMKEIGVALSKAHEAGIHHSELNPKKIFVKGDGNPVVTDFSICNLAGGRFCSLSDVSPETDTFLSPELIRTSLSDTGLCPLNDVYSFGKLLYYLVSGGRELPGEFHHESEFDLRIKDTSRLMLLVYKIFDRTITSDPGKRFQSINDILHLMDREMQEGTTCIFCNKGKYKPVSQNVRKMFWEINMSNGMKNYSPRLLVCDNCGNLQNFLDTEILKDDNLDESESVADSFTRIEK